jgi:hypothetical protein
MFYGGKLVIDQLFGALIIIAGITLFGYWPKIKLWLKQSVLPGVVSFIKDYIDHSRKLRFAYVWSTKVTNKPTNEVSKRDREAEYKDKLKKAINLYWDGSLKELDSYAESFEVYLCTSSAKEAAIWVTPQTKNQVGFDCLQPNTTYQITLHYDQQLAKYIFVFTNSKEVVIFNMPDKPKHRGISAIRLSEGKTLEEALTRPLLEKLYLLWWSKSDKFASFAQAFKITLTTTEAGNISVMPKAKKQICFQHLQPNTTYEITVRYNEQLCRYFIVF